VGIDTLHKEIELAENPLLEQPAARVRPLAAIERCCCYLSLLLLLLSAAQPRSACGQVQLHVWDKAAESDFATLDEAFFSGARVGLLVFSSADRASFERVKALKRNAEKMIQLQAEGSDIQWAVLQHKVDRLEELGTGRAQLPGSAGPAAIVPELPLHISPPPARAAGTVVSIGSTPEAMAGSGSSFGTPTPVSSPAVTGGVAPQSPGPIRPRARSAGVELESAAKAALPALGSPKSARVAAAEIRSAKNPRCVSTYVRTSAPLLSNPAVTSNCQMFSRRAYHADETCAVPISLLQNRRPAACQGARRFAVLRKLCVPTHERGALPLGSLPLPLELLLSLCSISQVVDTLFGCQMYSHSTARICTCSFHGFGQQHLLAACISRSRTDDCGGPCHRQQQLQRWSRGPWCC
jgi:hypothetical protein